MTCRGCEIKEDAAAVDVGILIEEQLSLESDLASQQTVNKRTEVCESCPFRVGDTCGKCGCYYKFRANLSTKRCPAGYW